MRRKNCVTLVFVATTGTAHQVNDSVKRRRSEREQKHRQSSASTAGIANRIRNDHLTGGSGIFLLQMRFIGITMATLPWNRVSNPAKHVPITMKMKKRAPFSASLKPARKYTIGAKMTDWTICRGTTETSKQKAPPLLFFTKQLAAPISSRYPWLGSRRLE